MSVLSLWCVHLCYSNDEFDSIGSDELLNDLMPPVKDLEQMDYTNQVCTATSETSCMASLWHAHAGC